MTDNAISIPHVRELARRDGSALLESATDEQIDRPIRQLIGRPAVTAAWLAAIAIQWAELDVLCDRLRAALADGSVLDAEPATDKELRAFRRVRHPHFDHPVAAHAQRVAARQLFLGRRLFTLAEEIVDETGADLDAVAWASAACAALGALACLQTAVARDVVMALPADEWIALRKLWERVMARVRTGAPAATQ